MKTKTSFKKGKPRPPGAVKNQFTTKKQPANPGRKRSIFKQLDELCGAEFGVEIPKRDKMRIIESLLERSAAEVKQIALDDTRPVFMRSVAFAISNDLKRGDLTILRSILSLVHGEPAQTVIVNPADEIQETPDNISRAKRMLDDELKS